MTKGCLVTVAAWLLLATLVAGARAGDEAAGSADAKAPPAGGRLQLKNLKDVPQKPRFDAVDRVWPARAGEAVVCLWRGDRKAAVSITIDDNCAPDHAWWDEQGRRNGFRMTWFVITERVGTGGWWGTWEGFGELLKAGHDVQSHTVTHNHGRISIEEEYRESAKAIEAGLPGHKVVCLAYPGGKGLENDPAVAAKYYVACRGVVGRPNVAGRINYLQTNSMSLSREWIDIVLGESDKEVRYKGGWMCTHYHGLRNTRDTKEEQDAGIARLAEVLAYLRQREADVWVGLFREVAQYGQERDTAKLTVARADAAEIRFTLSDDMADDLFALPLTVKVRLGDGWPEAVSASQGGKPVEATVIKHEGARFALVQAVPDKGEVLLRPSPAKE